MKKTTRIVLETKSFRFGYERIVEKPDQKKIVDTKSVVPYKRIDIRV